MKSIRDCVPVTDWLVIGIAVALMVVGTALTLTWVGAIIGVPMFLIAIELLANPKTLHGAPCAP